MGRHAVRYRETLPCAGHLCALGTCEGPGSWFGACGQCCRCTGSCLGASAVVRHGRVLAIEDAGRLPDEPEPADGPGRCEQGCCPDCDGTGRNTWPETNGMCPSCYATGHCHPVAEPCDRAHDG